MHIKFIPFATLLISVTASAEDEMLLLQLSSEQKKLSHPTAQNVAKRAVKHVQGFQLAEHRNHQLENLVFVEDLARRVVRGETHIDDNTKDVLSTMTSTLDQAHDYMQSAHNADQALLNEIGTRANTCLSGYQTSKSEDDADVASLATAHTGLRECRETQATLDAAMETACTALEQFATSLSVPACTSPGVDGLANFWVTHKAWYDTNEHAWGQYDAACTAARAAAEGKVEECDALQSSFESDSCTSRVDVLSTCLTYVTCRDEASADYGSALTSAGQGELARKAEWEAVAKIKCYVNVLLSTGDGTQKGEAVTACKELVTDTSHLTLVEPTVPDDQQCDLSSTTPYPCTDDFLQAKYDGLTNMKDCVACAPLPAHLAEIAGTSDENGDVLIMKVSKNGGNELAYDSALWENEETLNPSSAPDVDEHAKYPTFNTVGFQTIKMCMGGPQGSDNAKCVVHELAQAYSSAKELFTAGFVRDENLDRDGIIEAFGVTPGSYQVCPMQRPGFNSQCSDSNRARWGFCVNCASQPCQASDGDDADASIGIGLHGQNTGAQSSGWTGYFASGAGTCSSTSRTEVSVWFYVVAN